MAKEKHTCNQCFRQMKFTLAEVGVVSFYVCTNPDCPNYALVQIPVEFMPKVKGKKND